MRNKLLSTIAISAILMVIARPSWADEVSPITESQYISGKISVIGKDTNLTQLPRDRRFPRTGTNPTELPLCVRDPKKCEPIDSNIRLSPFPRTGTNPTELPLCVRDPKKCEPIDSNIRLSPFPRTRTNPREF